MIDVLWTIKGVTSVIILGAGLVFFGMIQACAQSGQDHPDLPEFRYPPHAMDRPAPPTVDPGSAGGPTLGQEPPSDAIVLFDGTDLSKWEKKDGGAPEWPVENGYAQVIDKSGSIVTKEKFGDCQLHVEWRVPAEVEGEGQDRGNSGVFLAERYEVQVLDSYDNPTYPDGQAGALYGQFPPLVNASRPPGEWQSYDIVFQMPRFADNGRLREPARMTVFHNGVLIQNNVALAGPTAHKKRPEYKAHPDRMRIMLQEHHDRVRYRNIWVRDLEK